MSLSHEKLFHFLQGEPIRRMENPPFLPAAALRTVQQLQGDGRQRLPVSEASRCWEGNWRKMKAKKADGGILYSYLPGPMTPNSSS